MGCRGGRQKAKTESRAAATKATTAGGKDDGVGGGDTPRGATALVAAGRDSRLLRRRRDRSVLFLGLYVVCMFTTVLVSMLTANGALLIGSLPVCIAITEQSVNVDDLNKTLRA